MILHTKSPKRMSSVITEKPPGQGDVYENLETIPLFDENGNPSGFAIGAGRHIPRPPIEIDVFDFTLGEIEIITPTGASEVVGVDGPATVHVFFEGTAEGDADDDDGNTRDEVATEMVALSLAGVSSLGPIEVRLNPAIRSTGEIEELVNNNPGRLDLDPFHPGDAESFFDVYFEIEIATPNGTVILHTESPKRMSSVITEKPPGQGNVYENLETIPLFDENGQPSGFAIGAGRHIPRPPIEI
ncbi:MAG: hypothetical protein GY728_06920, partial [Phycisphaeraceae bacterium]|nr:hypothetical protein [Phycisphaeraceae bacterium]